MPRKTKGDATILMRCDRHRWPQLHDILMRQNATFTTKACEVTEHTSGTVDVLVTPDVAGTIGHLAERAPAADATPAWATVFAAEPPQSTRPDLDDDLLGRLMARAMREGKRQRTMNGQDLYPLAAVARALNLPPRRIRSWADSGALNTLQPGFGAERLVTAAEIRRLQRAGYRVRWEVLSQPADAADAADAANTVTDARNDVR